MAKNMKNKVLDVNDLHVSFDTYAGEVQAVRGVTFQLHEGEVLAIVGESGCGKSVTAQTIMKLNPMPPARIPQEVSEKIRQTAVRAYRLLGCSGLARVGFFVTAGDNRVILNEINTLPGFTNISMFPKLFMASGYTYPQLLDRLIELALEPR